MCAVEVGEGVLGSEEPVLLRGGYGVSADLGGGVCEGECVGGFEGLGPAEDEFLFEIHEV